MYDDVIRRIREFNRFYTGVIGVTNNHILESSYSLSEVRVMFEIHHDPGISARRIKENMQVDEGYLSRLINKLVKKCIVRKIRSKDDNRISSLTLTKSGEAVFLALNERANESVAAIIHHLDKNEQVRLASLCGEIKRLLTKKCI